MQQFRAIEFDFEIVPLWQDHLVIWEDSGEQACDERARADLEIDVVLIALHPDSAFMQGGKACDGGKRVLRNQDIELAPASHRAVVNQGETMPVG